MTEDETDLFYLAVGKTITSLRAECCLTQTEVADAAGLTRSSIANLEAGRQRVPAHSLVAIARLFNVGIADLTGNAERSLPIADGALALIREQGREVARLKAAVKSARLALGDGCL